MKTREAIHALVKEKLDNLSPKDKKLILELYRKLKAKKSKLQEA